MGSMLVVVGVWVVVVDVEVVGVVVVGKERWVGYMEQERGPVHNSAAFEVDTV